MPLQCPCSAPAVPLQYPCSTPAVPLQCPCSTPAAPLQVPWCYVLDNCSLAFARGNVGSFGHRYLDCVPDLVEELPGDRKGLPGDDARSRQGEERVAEEHKVEGVAGAAAAAEAISAAEGRRLQGRRLQGRRLQAAGTGGVGGVGGMGGITVPAPSDLLHAWDEQA